MAADLSQSHQWVEILKLFVPPLLTFILGIIIERQRERRKHQADEQERKSRDAKLPALVVFFQPENGECVTPWHYPLDCPSALAGVQPRIEQICDSYVSIYVINVGGSEARNCRGLLTGIQSKVDGYWKAIPIGGNHPLIWSFDEKNVVIPAGSGKALNVVKVDGRTAHLALQISGGTPNLIGNIFDSPSSIQLTVLVLADNTQSKEITLGVRWTCKWEGSWPKGALWKTEPATAGNAIGQDLGA